MLKTYIGPHSPARVVIAGEDFGYVENGDSIAVDDELAESVAWPEDNWKDGSPKKTKNKTPDEGSDSDNGAADAAGKGDN